MVPLLLLLLLLGMREYLAFWFHYKEEHNKTQSSFLRQVLRDSVLNETH